jgi:hypothetical protein
LPKIHLLKIGSWLDSRNPSRKANRVTRNTNYRLESADMGPNRTSKTRNNRQPLVSGARRNRCNHKKTDTRLLASTLTIDGHTGDK